MIRGRLVCLAKRICWFWNMRFAQGCETKIFMRGLLPNVQAVKTVFSFLYILGIYMRCTLFHAIRSDWVRFLSLLSHLFLLSTILRYFTRLCIPLFTTVPYPALHSNNYALLSVPYCVVFLLHCVLFYCALLCSVSRLCVPSTILHSSSLFTAVLSCGLLFFVCSVVVDCNFSDCFAPARARN